MHQGQWHSALSPFLPQSEIDPREVTYDGSFELQVTFP